VLATMPEASARIGDFAAQAQQPPPPPFAMGGLRAMGDVVRNRCLGSGMAGARARLSVAARHDGGTGRRRGDAIARILAEGWRSQLGQPVIVETSAAPTA
jgi:hypothetical protein